jgi:hypothetical protein
MEVKTCSKCRVEKELGEFNKYNKSKDGYGSRCRSCQSAYYQANKERIEEKKRVWKAANPEKVAEYLKRWELANPEKRRDSRKKYYRNNTEKCLLSTQRWRKDNREHVSTYQLKVDRERRAEDPLFKFKGELRTIINQALSKKFYSNDSRFFKVLGAPSKVVSSHFDDQFIDGMGWENKGRHGWAIDHFIPLALAKTEEEAMLLCRYQNLQPLWAGDNRAKRDKVPSIEEIRARGLEDIWEAVNCGY